MIYPNVTLDDWLSKYDLETSEYLCPQCSKIYKVDVPALTKDSAWLVSPTHECGPGYMKAIGTPRTKEAKEFWETII